MSSKIFAIGSVIVICVLWALGTGIIIYSLVLEVIANEPIYITMIGLGVMLVSVATFLAIIQQKIEKLLK